MGEKNVGRKRKILLFAVTNLISFGCLIFALRDVRWADLQDDLKTMNWWWVAVAVIADIAALGRRISNSTAGFEGLMPR